MMIQSFPGEFGVVYKGHLTNWHGSELPLAVAVKTLKGAFCFDIAYRVAIMVKVVVSVYMHVQAYDLFNKLVVLHIYMALNVCILTEHILCPLPDNISFSVVFRCLQPCIYWSCLCYGSVCDNILLPSCLLMINIPRMSRPTRQ